MASELSKSQDKLTSCASWIYGRFRTAQRVRRSYTWWREEWVCFTEGCRVIHGVNMKAQADVGGSVLDQKKYFQFKLESLYFLPEKTIPAFMQLERFLWTNVPSQVSFLVHPYMPQVLSKMSSSCILALNVFKWKRFPFIFILSFTHFLSQ